MKDYYIESKNSMGYTLMHVGEYSSYSKFKKAVNSYINSLCLDNYYREFKVHAKPIQTILWPLSFFGMRIKIKTFKDPNKINESKYYCSVTELFRTDKDKKYYLEVA